MARGLIHHKFIPGTHYEIVYRRYVLGETPCRVLIGENGYQDGCQ